MQRCLEELEQPILALEMASLVAQLVKDLSAMQETLV